jgi:hypothetical protein
VRHGFGVQLDTRRHDKRGPKNAALSHLRLHAVTFHGFRGKCYLVDVLAACVIMFVAGVLVIGMIVSMVMLAFIMSLAGVIVVMVMRLCASGFITPRNHDEHNGGDRREHDAT